MGSIICFYRGFVIGGVLLAGSVCAAEYHVAKTGADSNDGLSLPNAFLTIQRGVDAAVNAGDVVTVYEGTYTEINFDGPASPTVADLNSSSADYGIVLRNSGVVGNPITIRVADGERVVLDLGNVVKPNGGQETVLDFQGFDVGGLAATNARRMGFVVSSGTDFVTIKGFEIRGAATGIRANSGGPEGIVVENCYIHDIVGEFVGGGAGSGPDNLAAVFLQDCTDCIVQNNVLKNVAIVRNGVLAPLLDFSNSNSAGILMFRPRNELVQNNDISNTYAGVYRKQAPPAGVPDPGGRYRKNVFHDLTNGIRLSIAGQGNEGHFNQEISENIFYKVTVGVLEDAQESATQSNNIGVFNNTMLVNLAIDLHTATNVRFYNNIVANLEPGNLTLRLFGDAVLKAFVGAPDVPVRPSLALSDFNLFFDPDDGQPFFRLDNAAPEIELHTTLASWQAGAPSHAPVAVPVADPNSILGDPMLTNSSGLLFELDPASPARSAGRVGGIFGGAVVDMGAYPNGANLTNIVGPVTRPLPPAALGGAS